MILLVLFLSLLETLIIRCDPLKRVNRVLYKIRQISVLKVDLGKKMLIEEVKREWIMRGINSHMCFSVWAKLVWGSPFFLSSFKGLFNFLADLIIHSKFIKRPLKIDLIFNISVFYLQRLRHCWICFLTKKRHQYLS